MTTSADAGPMVHRGGCHCRAVRYEVRAPARIVALGGGTGLSTLLHGLKTYKMQLEETDPAAPSLDLSAVVTVSDDGGSSGKLRRDFDILAPGDLRNCMVALAEDEALLSRLFQYRFAAGEGLQGHSFGNLFLAALTEVTGDFHQAIQLSSEVLAINGRIFPSTLCNVKLEATMRNGRSMVGETRISSSRDGIRRVRLLPRECDPAPGALEAIAEADLISLGPGSLYTSVIPNLLVQGVTPAIRESSAPVVYICNLMWEPGETEGYTAADHLQAVLEHSEPGLIDYVIVNDQRVSAGARERYAEQNARPVELDAERLAALGVQVISTDLVAEGATVRHHADKLARMLADLVQR